MSRDYELYLCKDTVAVVRCDHDVISAMDAEDHPRADPAGIRAEALRGSGWQAAQEDGPVSAAAAVPRLSAGSGTRGRMEEIRHPKIRKLAAEGARVSSSQMRPAYGPITTPGPRGRPPGRLRSSYDRRAEVGEPGSIGDFPAR
jgi:hypothetical protein